MCNKYNKSKCITHNKNIINLYNHTENIFYTYKEAQNSSFVPEIPFLNIYPKKMKTLTQKDTCT